jgi:glycosyltransferase involved in cell wall biosynthesis
MSSSGGIKSLRDRIPHPVQDGAKLNRGTIHLVSPIWPSSKKRSLGAFIKVIADTLENQGWTVTKRAVGHSEARGILEKVSRYGRMICGIIVLPFVKRGIVYVHLPTWFSFFLMLSHFVRPQPYVVNLHGSDIHARKRVAQLFWPITRRYIAHADLVIVPSQTFASAVMETIDTRRIIVSPSGGILTDRFHPTETATARSRLNLPADAIVLGFISRIVSGKGWQTFVDAIEILRRRGFDVRGIMLGEGPEEPSLRKEITLKDLGEVIEFRGAVYQSDLPDYYNSMDIFMFPSKISNVDSLGLVALEAMSCGTPVIALDAKLTREYVEPGHNGELSAAPDGASFAEAFLKLQKWHLNNAEQKRTIAATVSRYANHCVGIELSEEFLSISASRTESRRT